MKPSETEWYVAEYNMMWHTLCRPGRVNTVVTESAFFKLMCRVSRHNSTNEITGRMRRMRVTLGNGRAGPVLPRRGGISHRLHLCQTLGTGSHPRIAHLRWQGIRVRLNEPTFLFLASDHVCIAAPDSNRFHAALLNFGCHMGEKKAFSTVATCTGQVNWSAPSSSIAEQTERTPTVSYWLTDTFLESKFTWYRQVEVYG